MTSCARVTVTGGGGFLGMHLVPRLAAAGHEVTVLDDVSTPPWAERLGIRYLTADVRDADAVADALHGADVVAHAAFAPPRASAADLHEVNVRGTRLLCAHALLANVRRLVLVSSTIVERPPRAHPLSRAAPLSRLDAYRASRLEAETVARAHGARGLEVAVARPKTFIGPGRVGGFALTFGTISRGGAVPLLGSGENRYQLLDVRDLAEGLARLVTADGEGVFWFGATRFGTVADDLQGLIDHAGTAARLRRVPAVASRVAVRAVELAGMTPLAEWHHCVARGEDRIVEVRRAADELGWVPRRSNPEALADAYDWYAGRCRERAAVPATHPVPLSHRLLRRAADVGLR